MESKLYNQSGKEIGTFDAPENIFGLPWNADLVHQVVVSMQANACPHVANTKGKGQVRGGGKKPWQQKGTGRARAGSIRSPLWRGGGTTFGPHPRRYGYRLPRAKAQLALRGALSAKAAAGDVLVLDQLAQESAKTRTVAQLIKDLKLDDTV